MNPMKYFELETPGGRSESSFTAKSAEDKERITTEFEIKMVNF